MAKCLNFKYYIILLNYLQIYIYACFISYLNSEKRPEAMQHEDSGTSLSCSLLSVLFASLITMVVQSLQIKDQELCKPAQPTECSLSKAETITVLSTNKSNVLHWEGNAQEVQKSLEVSVRSKELSQFTKSTTTLISCKDKFEWINKISWIMTSV